MGYLTASGNYSESGLRQAIIFGSVMASFNVEAFSLDRMKRLTREEIDERFRAFKHLTHFDNLS
ncbi:MAG: sugar kinase, partial [Nitrospira sp.]|nr:sugar kinase [Nitrospira sp.]